MYRRYNSIRNHMEEMRRSAGVENSELDNYYRARWDIIDSYNQEREHQELVNEIVNEVMKRIRIELEAYIPNIKNMIIKGLGL